MKQDAFELLRKAEHSWWYAGRSLAIASMLARAQIVSVDGPILDFGAGYGGMYRELRRLNPHVYAFEPNLDARTAASEHEYEAVYSSSDDALSRQYHLIGLFDVIEHIENDETFLLSLHDALVPEGLVAITVPAFQFLWSEHDVTHQHFRRYNKHSLSERLSAAGYEVITISYWNTLLFIPAAIMRLLGQSGSSALSVSGFINHIVLGIVTIESKMLRWFSLPFGISLVVIAKKKAVRFD